jgi:type I restriction enzyme S subunit
MSDLPQGWEDASIEDLATLNPKHSRHILSGAAISFVPMPAVNDATGEIESAKVRGFAEVSKGYTRFELGDVIFAKITPCMENGKIAVARKLTNDVGCGSTEFHVLRPKEGISADYLWRFLRQKSFRTDAERSMTGAVGQRRVPLEFLKNARVPLPPSNEQRRIVTKIDSLSGKSKRARDHLDHVPRLVEKYKQAMLAAAFRGDLTAEWRTASGHSISTEELGMLRKSAWQHLHDSGRASGRHNTPDGIDWRPPIDLPPSWIWASVDQVSCLIQYGTSARTIEDIQGVAVLRMGNIQNGTLDLTSLKFLPEEHDEFPELLLESGDVLFNRTNSAELVGKSAVYRGTPDRASFASYLIRVHCSGLLPDLLSGYINSAYGREWVASVVSQQVGQANVNGTKLRQLGIPVMPSNEQSEIVWRVNAAFAWIDRLASESTSARRLIDHLDQAVLAKAFRGELVPQHPDDEPASVLLERIRAERAASPASVRSNPKPLHGKRKR